MGFLEWRMRFCHISPILETMIGHKSYPQNPKVIAWSWLGPGLIVGGQ